MVLLFYTKIHWLARGKCLSPMYKLKNEVEIFLRQNKNNLHVQFHNEKFAVMLANLAGVFDHLNDMNLSLQFIYLTKLARLTARIGVWQAGIKVESTTSFPLLERRRENE